MRKEHPSVRFIEQCYELYEQKMYRVAYNILHDTFAAEDAVQDAFVRLMRSQACFEDPDSDDCKKYIITVIRNASIDIYNQRTKEIAGVPEFEELSEYVGTSKSDEMGIEEHDSLRSLVRKLPEKYRLVTECLALEEMSVKETSIKLGISEPLVRKRYERAKAKLREGGTDYEK